MYASRCLEYLGTGYPIEARCGTAVSQGDEARHRRREAAQAPMPARGLRRRWRAIAAHEGSHRAAWVSLREDRSTSRGARGRRLAERRMGGSCSRPARQAPARDWWTQERLHLAPRRAVADGFFDIGPRGQRGLARPSKAGLTCEGRTSRSRWGASEEHGTTGATEDRSLDTLRVPLSTPYVLCLRGATRGRGRNSDAGLDTPLS
jgi:hypothetical protein